MPPPFVAFIVGWNLLNGNGTFLSTGGVWVNTSDSSKKEQFSQINKQDLLRKLLQLDIQQWKYKGTDEFHIGPTAQQFYNLFNIGVNDKSISTVDPAGIALAAIQEQQRMIENQNEMINELKKEMMVLKQTVLPKQ